MALAQATYALESAIGHTQTSETAQDITNPSQTPGAGDDSDTMLALTWAGKNTVKMVRTPKPAIMEPRDVILKVTGSTVCGSDLHLLHGAIVEMKKGDILGHEFCGEVAELGAEAGRTGLKKGDRVVASFQIACGDCYFCKQKLSSQCEKTNANTLESGMYAGGVEGNTAGMFGYSHFTGGFAGGQAEYVRVPNGDVNLLKLPSDVPDEKGLYLSDVLATSYHCVVDTGVQKNDVVAIWGAGPIGQMCVEFAFLEGAREVILVDSNWRLQYVQERYAKKFPDRKLRTLDYKNLPKGCGNVVSTLRKWTENRGPDVALECVAGEYAKGWAHWAEMQLGLETDTSEIVNEMIESVRNFGRCGITGVYAGYTNHFNIGSLMERGIRLIGNGQAPVHLYWEKLLKWIQDGTIDPLIMVSHRVDVSELDTVYYKFEKKQDEMQKVFVQTRFSAPPAKGSPALTTYKK